MTMKIPFPFPLAIGTDLCSANRIYNILCRPNGTRLLSRIFNEEEKKQERIQKVFSLVDNRTVQTVENPIQLSRSGIRASDENGRTLDKAVSRQERDPDLWDAAYFVAGR